MDSIISTGLTYIAAGMQPRLFDLDLQLLVDAVLSIIAVVSLFFIASYLLFNPVRDMLEKRRSKIKDELDSAKNDMEDAAKIKKEYEAKLRKVDKEAEAILADTRKKALVSENKILLHAKEEAAAILERARTEAELEKRKAADEVKKEMIVIASMMAGKVVSASIDTAIQESLINETLKEIGESTWLS